MKSKMSVFHRNQTIYVVPFLVILWGVYSYLTSLPFYVKGSDPEYPYLINGLNCALLKFGQIGHTDHPGTPFQVYNGLIIRIVHLLAGKDSIAVDVLTRPEFYLGAISISLTLLAASLVFIIGKIGIQNHRITNVLILQLSLFYQQVLLDLFNRCNPDRFLAIVTLLFVIVLLKFLFTETPNQLKLAAWLGLVMGLGFATKINYLPLLVFVLFLLNNWKCRGIYAISGLLSFALFISPILGKFQAFKRFVFEVISHDGLYGSGDSRILNMGKILDNLKVIFTTNPELLFIVLLLLAALIVVLWKPKGKREGLPFVLGYMVLILIQLVIVAKHYKNYYLVPLFSTYGIFLFGIVFLFENSMGLRKVTAVMKYGLLILLLFISLAPFLSTDYNAIAASNTYRKQAAQFVESHIGKEDYWFVEPTWESGPQVENALVYGFSYCADRVKYEAILHKVYPHVITSVDGSNDVKFWHSSFASLDTVLISGKKIHVLSTPSRHAGRLINVVKDEASRLGIPVSLDTIFKQLTTSTYIVALNSQIRPDQADSLQSQFEIKYSTKKSNFDNKIDHYIQEIKNTPEWLSTVRQKAKDKGIPLDSMIYLDAVYMAERN
ncbi:hypothetical protein [Mangrovibacterium lignilyticum]|uniref:hypothetical protein n=1 Tax=Mangrovibacterium lignilyticum TaxID=2668052 RepID=UPI0013D46449|nr:hypothetical protein [Mangrovibacterium lignilyticum]